MAIVGMMTIPLPTPLLDVLIASRLAQLHFQVAVCVMHAGIDFDSEFPKTILNAAHRFQRRIVHSEVHSSPTHAKLLQKKQILFADV